MFYTVDGVEGTFENSMLAGASAAQRSKQTRRETFVRDRFGSIVKSYLRGKRIS